MRKSTRLLFAMLLCLLVGTRAVSFGTALSFQRNTDRTRVAHLSVPRSVSFHDVPGRGLLVQTWVNSAGPFRFAIDTGAGATLLSPRVATIARAIVKAGRGSSIAGLSGVAVAAQNVTVHSFALGESDNILPGTGNVLVSTELPRDIDGVLDPTESFSPLGYSIDIPAQELTAFDPRQTPLTTAAQPEDGATVPWLHERDDRRPFVQLDNGDRALLDTGSSLGLAIKESTYAPANASSVHDVGGGRVGARRGRPTTIAIGSMTLRNIPTDIVSGAEVDAPVLLGLSALRPFRLRFDPVHHLIEIAPGEHSRR